MNRMAGPIVFVVALVILLAASHDLNLHTLTNYQHASHSSHKP